MAHIQQRPATDAAPLFPLLYCGDRVNEIAFRTGKQRFGIAEFFIDCDRPSPPDYATDPTIIGKDGAFN